MRELHPRLISAPCRSRSRPLELRSRISLVPEIQSSLSTRQELYKCARLFKQLSKTWRGFLDVAYKSSRKQPIQGSYVTIVFEKQPYTITSDREICGLPAVLSDIVSEHSSNHYVVTAESNGLDWANLTVEDLQLTTAQKSFILPDEAADLGLLSWRSVPKGGAEIDSEVESFAVEIPFDTDDTSIQVQQTYTSSKASIRFSLQDPARLGTLTPTVERLSEIPDYGILGVKGDRRQRDTSFQTNKSTTVGDSSTDTVRFHRAL